MTTSSPRDPAEDETNSRIVALAKDCVKIAQQIIDSLNYLGITDCPRKGIRKRKALVSAFKIQWGNEKIVALQTQLDQYRNQIMLGLNISLRFYATKSLHNQDLILQLLQSRSNNDQLRRNGSSTVNRHEGLGSALVEYLKHAVATPESDNAERTFRNDLLGAVYVSARPSSNDASAFELTEARKLALHNKFILSLHYDGIRDRELRIAEAHQETFRWIFDPEDDQRRPWANFRHWLQSDEQLYWITGKAGAGKSTLMKYISQPASSGEAGRSHDGESRCTEYLLRWARKKPLIVASFYFWAAGFKMQTSREGLYRTLLSQICQSCPEAIPYASPERWEALCLCNEDPKPFDEIELRNILDSVIKFVSSTKSLCLFIDGLDEFNGTHGDLIEFVKNMIETLPVKICVASRPWVVFEAALEGKPSLMIEDLTFDDIKRYVTSRFESDAEFVSLQNREIELARNLIEDVVRKASGVFLWVSIVVSSLLDGIKYGDRVSDLQRQLSQLPPDLESLYDRILSNLDPFYLEHAAQYFHLMTACERLPEALLLSFADEEEPDFAFKLPNTRVSHEHVAIRIESIRKRLNSRCKGFVYIPKLGQEPSYHELRTVTAQYHHRTVKDYVEQPKIQEKILGMMKGPFDPYLKLCSGSLSMYKAVGYIQGTLRSMRNHSGTLEEGFRFDERIWRDHVPLKAHRVFLGMRLG
ncbi:hypothetical protein F4813DRAFT_210740 [Daldinia decipiens]|uniref:uncharacterized protein n=1 Tax=Daldinia decipiens TaxID=326647 RepID=UPI0020C417EC|nr:uncharacterized protein F4813DRAFT_210740 [Daldinia decipiens]KAI1654265.1 hypothetical protein F4813DRAFT_210740 [Daldinia decipiens]